MDSDKGKYLVYCSKCSLFYVAEPADGLYVLTKVNPKEINFIPQPYMLDGEMNHGAKPDDGTDPRGK